MSIRKFFSHRSNIPMSRGLSAARLEKARRGQVMDSIRGDLSRALIDLQAIEKTMAGIESSYNRDIEKVNDLVELLDEIKLFVKEYDALELEDERILKDAEKAEKKRAYDRDYRRKEKEAREK